MGEQLYGMLDDDGHHVIVVRTGKQFHKQNQQLYTIRPEQREDFVALLQCLQDDDVHPERILHLWTLCPSDPPRKPIDAYKDCERLGFFSLLYLAQAIGDMAWVHNIQIQVLTNGLAAIGRKEVVTAPEKATLLGPVLVMPREYPNLKCQLIDVELPTIHISSQARPSQGHNLYGVHGPRKKIPSIIRSLRGRQKLPRVPRLPELSRPSAEYDEIIDQLTPILLDPPLEGQLALRDTGLWAAYVEQIGLSDTTQNGQPIAQVPGLRQEGVYVFTGGLGGIGSALASHLAETYQARLALIGRTPLPDRPDWAQWLETRGPAHPISQKIAQVQALERLGASVMVLCADVADEALITEAIGEIRQKWGVIHGVIHAAGTLDDKLIQIKETAAAKRVLQPKTLGAIHLSQALKEDALDFMLLFSSTSTLLAPAGQVDYVAANAFLNAFAQSKQVASNKVVRNTETSTRTTALNWGAWQDVGMTANQPQSIRPQSVWPKGELRANQSHWVSHPLLEQCLVRSNKEAVYTATFQNSNWILDQHRLQDGTAIMPGTGYVEMIAAAANDIVENASSGRTDNHRADTPIASIHIQDLFFLSPFTVQDDERGQISLLLEEGYEGEYMVTLRSQPRVTRTSMRQAQGSQSRVNQMQDDEIEHVSAQVISSTQLRPTLLLISEIRQRCQKQRIEYAPGQQQTQQEQYLAFGPRWKNLLQIDIGEGEAVARLALLPEFAEEAKLYWLHPALLDLATSFALPLVPGYDQSDALFVPVSYGSIKIYRSLPSQVYSYAKLHATASLHFPTFDVTITDERGEVLVEIQSFTLKKVAPDALIVPSQPDGENPSAKPTLLEEITSKGIRPHEGIAVLEQITQPSSANYALCVIHCAPSLTEGCRDGETLESPS